MLALDLARGLDPVRWCEGIGFAPDAKQRALLCSRSRYIARCTSRQWGKSTSAALMTAHRLQYRGAFALVVSPTQRQSDELFAKLKGYLAASIEGETETTVQRVSGYAMPRRRVGAGRSVTVEQVADEWNVRSLTLRNGARAVSLPGAPENIRGYSAATDVLVDEAAFVDDALFAAVRPMLRVSRGRLVMLSTPNGRRGEFYRVMSSGGEHWDRDVVTVDDNPRIDPADVEIDRRELPAWLFRQEYYCEFTETLGAVFAERDIGSAIVEEATWNL